MRRTLVAWPGRDFVPVPFLFRRARRTAGIEPSKQISHHAGLPADRRNLS
jgi:hypothetical protein